jgi:hypothetical protein
MAQQLPGDGLAAHVALLWTSSSVDWPAEPLPSAAAEVVCTMHTKVNVRHALQLP